jgi:transglutaminase-like putative cysteine protease
LVQVATGLKIGRMKLASACASRIGTSLEVKTWSAMKIRIQHQTVYRYVERVAFGPHRLMLRPREGHDIHVEKLILEISPSHRIRWIRDVYGNSIAVVDFIESASELSVYSEAVLDHDETNPFDFQIEPQAFRYPFVYDRETALELSVLLQPAYPDDTPAVREWMRQFWQQGHTTETLAMLQQMNGQISHGFQYQVRHEPGVQPPALTLARASGSCRDFATLFIEACRCLGLGARFVSGYILSGSAGASTHAWAEAYLPGGGWKGFDPTLGLLTTAQHVAVAVSRHPENATPIAGSYLGPTNAPAFVDVSVQVQDISFQSPAATPPARQFQYAAQLS